MKNHLALLFVSTFFVGTFSASNPIEGTLEENNRSLVFSYLDPSSLNRLENGNLRVITTTSQSPNVTDQRNTSTSIFQR